MMSLPRRLAIVPAAAIVLAALRPAPAHALDLTSYVAATVSFVKAGTYREYGDDEKADSARTLGVVFLCGGLLLDSIALLLLTGGVLDRVQDLDAELAHGGGPVTEAYAAAFGMTQDEVLACIRASVERRAAGGDAEAEQAELLGRLLERARMSDAVAGRILYAFHEERAHVGQGATPWHDALARHAGVPVGDLAPVLAAGLDARLARGARPDAVVSARAVLAADGAATLRGLMERVYDAHAATIDARVVAAAQAPVGRPAVP